MINVGVMFANGAAAAEPEHAATLAVAAERAGYDSLWAVQHVVMPVEHASEYPYSASGTVPGGTVVKLIVTDSLGNALVYLDNVPAINDLTNSSNALATLLALYLDRSEMRQM